MQEGIEVTGDVHVVECRLKLLKEQEKTNHTQRHTKTNPTEKKLPYNADESLTVENTFPIYNLPFCPFSDLLMAQGLMLPIIPFKL